MPEAKLSYPDLSTATDTMRTLPGRFTFTSESLPALISKPRATTTGPWHRETEFAWARSVDPGFGQPEKRLDRLPIRRQWAVAVAAPFRSRALKRAARWC